MLSEVLICRYYLIFIPAIESARTIFTFFTALLFKALPITLSIGNWPKNSCFNTYSLLDRKSIQRFHLIGTQVAPHRFILPRRHHLRNQNLHHTWWCHRTKFEILAYLLLLDIIPGFIQLVGHSFKLRRLRTNAKEPYNQHEGQNISHLLTIKIFSLLAFKRDSSDFKNLIINSSTYLRRYNALSSFTKMMLCDIYFFTHQSLYR